VMKGIGQTSVGGSASTDAAPARNAIRMRRHPQASTIVWARRVRAFSGKVGTGFPLENATAALERHGRRADFDGAASGESLTDSSLATGNCETGGGADGATGGRRLSRSAPFGPFWRSRLR
jgi:hypothetical protein